MSHICDLPYSPTGWRVDPDEQGRGFAVWHDGTLVFQTPCGCDQCRNYAYQIVATMTSAPAALGVCQHLQEHFDGPVDLETIRGIAADAVKVLVAVEATKSALTQPIPDGEPR